MAFNLDDYKTVPERISEFRDKYPEGSLQQVDLQFVDFAGGSWVVYTAAAYRSPFDSMPGHGTAWEPVPGKTQFTRDSELQNAETAAWGRAIVAVLAADVQKGIASREDVRNRQTADGVVVREWSETIAGADSEKALKAMWDQIGAAGLGQEPALIRATNARKKELQDAANAG